MSLWDKLTGWLYQPPPRKHKPIPTAFKVGDRAGNPDHDQIELLYVSETGIVAKVIKVGDPEPWNKGIELGDILVFGRDRHNDTGWKVIAPPGKTWLTLMCHNQLTMELEYD